MTPYYRDDSVTIYHGDCRTILAELSADLLLTDPPYNFGFKYGTHNDSMSAEDYAEWCGAWFLLARSVTKRALVFPGHGNLPVWWKLQQPSSVGCWYKPGNPASSHLGWDEWEPYLYWGQRVGGSSVTKAPVSKQGDTGDHPCPKPLVLGRALLAKFKPLSLIDPFMGSGTFIRAAKDYGCPAIGIEIEEKYCEIAAKRMAQEVLAL